MLEVEPMDWDDFAPWFSDRWEPGEHVEVEAPTGAGKTTLVARLGELREHVLALDPKGGDPTLAATGWPRLSSWPPPRRVYDEMEPHAELVWGWPPWRQVEPKPQRLIVGPRISSHEHYPRLKEVLGAALDGAFDQGSWTVIVDELQIAADQRLMNLTAKLERNYIAARAQMVSMVGLHQAPRRVPRAAGDQSRWMFVSLTYDADMVDRIAEQAGRPKPEVRGAMRGIGSRRFTWGMFSRDPHDPLIVTRPPKLR